MNRLIPKQSFLDGPNVTWTDILRHHSNHARANSIKSKLANVKDPLERTLLKSELELLGQENEDHDMI